MLHLKLLFFTYTQIDFALPCRVYRDDQIAALALKIHRRVRRTYRIEMIRHHRISVCTFRIDDTSTAACRA